MLDVMFLNPKGELIMKLYNQSEITARIARICRLSGKIDAEIHVVLCSILTHTYEHGDPRNFVALCTTRSMPSSCGR